MNLMLLAALTMLPFSVSAQAPATRSITLGELQDKVAGAWIGQLIGNIYGLPFENKFVDEPGNDADWPYGYSKNLAKLEKYDGAFSDDDTDFEYVYLMLMEKYGIEPTYAQMREGWMYHVRDRVWLANRAALGLMHYGFTPPFTGMKDYNPHWYQIDPQLINEIWGYTAPGMPDYAAEKSAWAARITSDDWATGPTTLYGAMYAEAFFEKDVRKLVENALYYLPDTDRYKNTVKEMLTLHDKYPHDWKAARKEMAKKYYIDEPAQTKTIWNSNLNGACFILALLYGNGNFQVTMDYGCAMGFDCDNQAATLGGLLGVMYGARSFPDNLTMPIKGWKKPFNDKYVNITRYDMPDASVQDQIDRIYKQAVKVVLAKGGKIQGKRIFINTKAQFKAPLEFCIGPMPKMEIDKPVNYSFACVTNKDYDWELVKGAMPEGVSFNGGNLSGMPVNAGKYPITLSLSDGKQTINKDFTLLVRGKNIAPEADSIIASVRKANLQHLYTCWITFGKPIYADTVSVINDGKVNGDGSVFYSIEGKFNKPKIDWFGYEWKEPKDINMMAFNGGCLEEFGGWFTDVDIQYRDETGHWKNVGDFTSTPALPETDIVFFQPHFAEYVFEFPTVRTSAIRILLQTADIDHWNKPTKGTSDFISITELSVYEASAASTAAPKVAEVKTTSSALKDKIRGGWAGQTIGVVYGAPVEFKFTGSMIQDYEQIPWNEHYIKYWWDKKPGLFDDIYNDLTFVEALDQDGLDCSSEKLAKRFAYTDYHLAHANQASRYNIKQGIMPPESGNWKNNPHADDIDFQIESDFIGLMTPGLAPQAMEIASRVGHIMNSGDGFYGGAFTSGLYSAAFVYDNPEDILNKALETIPAESEFYQCIDEVRKLHAKYPDDWTKCWFEIEKRWSEDVGCPKGVFLSFDIDAKLNSAYVAIGLLYGGGDFGKSMEIAARCGQDADCNPSTVGGVLGVMLGYDGIPAKWREPLSEIESLNFEGTDMSLAKGTDMSYAHAVTEIRNAGGSVTGDGIVIPQKDAAVLPLERNFTGMYPYYRDKKDCFMDGTYEFDFDGNGFVVWGNLVCLKNISRDYVNRVSSKHLGSEVFALAEPEDPYVAKMQVWIDGKLDQTLVMPMKNVDRKLEPAWKYCMKEGKHTVKLVWLNPDKDYTIRINDIVYYSEDEKK
jgi:ADP-ribosylglycohydrolase